MQTNIPTATTNLFQVKDIAEFTSMISEYPDVQVQLFEDNYVSLQTKHPIWPLLNPNDKDVDNHSYEDHHFAYRIAKHLKLNQESRGVHMPTVFDVAKLILNKFEYGVSTMKLQKLTYLAHGWYLGIFQEPLSDTEFEAWRYGPVSRELYNVHGNEFTLDGRELPQGHIDNLDQRRQKIINMVVQQYGVLTGPQLSDFTCEPNTPWAETKEGDVISNDVISHYFREFLQDKLRDAYVPQKKPTGVTWRDIKAVLDNMTAEELESPALLFDDQKGNEIPIRYVPTKFDGDAPFDPENRYSITYKHS